MTIPTVETERLRLRAWEARDFPAYAAFKTDHVEQRYAGGAMSPGQVWQEFCTDLGVWHLRGYGIFAIARAEDDEAIGFTGFWQPLDLDEPELCWSLFPGNRGKGYATEGALAARTWAYQALDLPPLISFVHPDNHASQAVAERLEATMEIKTFFRGMPRYLYRHPKPANHFSSQRPCG